MFEGECGRVLKVRIYHVYTFLKYLRIDRKKIGAYGAQ